ncbi:hypothetical protein BGW39_004621 [Mortierella sp. 14UC]|nr:hypothetical protein BGW39_004621 [Mortierella sp. 14UC]
MTAASALLLLLTLLVPSPWPLSSLSGLVAAEGFSFKKLAVPDPAQVTAEEQAIARLKALKKASSFSAQENTDTDSNNSNSDNDDSNNDAVRKLRVSKGKGKGIEGLLNVVVAGSSSSPLPPINNTNANSDDNNNNNGDHNTAFDAHPAPSTDSDSAATAEQGGAADPAPNQKVLSSSPGKKKTTGHESDIIHEHDHADNDAYDDIVWYSGPHRDDEDEHGDEEHHDDDHHDGDHHYENEHFDEHHHDEEDHIDGEQGSSGLKNQEQHPSGVKRDASGADTGSSESVESTFDNMSNSNSNHLQQRILNEDNNNNDNPASTPSGHDHDHSTGQGGGDLMVFHHSGAEVLVGPISPVEFCLRLKHECESTCREFRSQVLHVSTSCEFGSVAELLLWGKCCQIGQVNRKASSHSLPSARAQLQQQHQQQPIAAQDSSSSLSSSKQQEQKQGGGGESTAATAGAESSERQEELAQEHLQWQQQRHAAQQERERERILQQQQQN